MNVLALNAGSGSLRYKLFARPGGGGPPAEGRLKDGTFDRVQGRATAEAAGRAVADCRPLGIDAIGCRVVHGGDRFTDPTRVTPEARAAIRELADLAPLHNPTD